MHRITIAYCHRQTPFDIELYLTIVLPNGNDKPYKSVVIEPLSSEQVDKHEKGLFDLE